MKKLNLKKWKLENLLKKQKKIDKKEFERLKEYETVFSIINKKLFSKLNFFREGSFGEERLNVPSEIKGFANRYFFVYTKYLDFINIPLQRAKIHTLPRTYKSLSLFIPLIVFAANFLISFIAYALFTDISWLLLRKSLFFAFVSMLLTFFIFMIYPYYRITTKKNQINTDIAFAVNQMAAISTSGITPYDMFKIMGKSKEFGFISTEARNITNYVDDAGLDILSAIKEVADKTPSRSLSDILYGLSSVISEGGSMDKYLKVQADHSMLDYKIAREKYSKMVSTYADLYIALLIAAPLIIIAMLAMMNVLGGTFMGLTLERTVTIGVFIALPLLNLLYLSFLEITQPSV